MVILSVGFAFHSSVERDETFAVGLQTGVEMGAEGKGPGQVRARACFDFSSVLAFSTASWAESLVLSKCP